MTTFARNEIVSATQLVRQFSSFMTNLRNHTVEKVGIIRNNEMEAVIIPIDEYENLKALEAKAKKKSVKDYFGTMDNDSFDAMMVALEDCRKVDVREW